MLAVLVIALIVIWIIISKRVLIVVCCIDERVDELEECLCAIRDVTSRDVLGVFRKGDVKCKAIVQDYIEVPDYDTSTTTRHNLDGIASKRTAALDYARTNGYDRLIFIDSDIRIDWYTYLDMTIRRESNVRKPESCHFIDVPRLVWVVLVYL